MGTEQRGIAGAGIHTELGTPLSEVHGAIWAVPDSPHTVILQFHYTWYTLNTTVRCDVEKSRITGGLGRSRHGGERKHTGREPFNNSIQ